MRCAPSVTNISPTADLPHAKPPVKPTFSIEEEITEDTEEHRESQALCAALCPPWFGLGSRLYQFAGPAPQLHGAHGIDHKHGNGERPDAAGHRSDGPGNLRHFGVNISDQRRTL